MIKRRRTREGEMLEQTAIGKPKQDLDSTSPSKRKKARRGAESQQQLRKGVGSRAVETAQDETATATTDGEFPSRIKVSCSLCYVWVPPSPVWNDRGYNVRLLGYKLRMSIAQSNQLTNKS